MKYLFMILLVCASGIAGHAQHSLKVIVRHERQPLAGATVMFRGLKVTAIADSSGTAVFSDLPAGVYRMVISYAGMEDLQSDVTIPAQSAEVIIEMEATEEEEEVIVSATRGSRSIRDIPTRVETISGEELDEKSNMKPGDIRMLLSETTGIQTQQTSATSYNSSIRIQGLDGRYTQILRDGLPLYAGFSGGLSLMQVAPLDLRQVEVIKGSSSTLYGGGAIAGLVNLVSKTPSEVREISFVANGTSALGLDLSAFYSQKFKSTGITVFGSRNTGRPYDPAGIGLTAIPEFNRYTINPRLFFYGKKLSGNAGLSYIRERRTGGSVDYIRHGSPGYFEENRTSRITGQFSLQYTMTASTTMNLKTSFTDFDRSIAIPSYRFGGVQRSSYSELNLTRISAQHLFIGGINILTDNFNESRESSSAIARDYSNTTFGVFIQHTWKPGPEFSLESGLRADQVSPYGVVVLPRISAMFKPTTRLTFRLGGGLGYKTPTVFNEETEKVQFRNIMPINDQLAGYEQSLGGNLDVNYRTAIGRLGIVINQLFFYTRLNHPLVLASAGNNEQYFGNSAAHLDSKGIETNLRLTMGHFKLFAGYSYTDVNTHLGVTQTWLPLTARHRLNNVLMFEAEDQWKLGLEGYYFSRQRLNDGSTGKSYWTTGFMAEKLWEKFSVFINFENFLDTRQTRFDTIYTGPLSNPVFRDIYAPVDGFVVNGGVKIRF